MDNKGKNPARFLLDRVARSFPKDWAPRSTSWHSGAWSSAAEAEPRLPAKPQVDGLLALSDGLVAELAG